MGLPVSPVQTGSVLQISIGIMNLQKHISYLLYFKIVDLLFHCHFMHWSEVDSNIFLAILPFIKAEVMAKVHCHFSNHDRILQVAVTQF